jgi:uncharacterized protein (UPF0335 family)
MKWNKKFKYPESTKSIQKSFKAKLPSVSTILKETMSDEKRLAIQKWMERVGNEEAEKIIKELKEIYQDADEHSEDSKQNFEKLIKTLN